MKIAVICDVFGALNNGTVIAANNLIDALRRKGHTVRVVCADENYRGQTDYYIVPKYNFGPLNRYVEKNGVAPAKVKQDVLEAAIADVDLVHVMLPFSLGKAAAQYAHTHGIPLSAGFHAQAENVTNHIFLHHFRLANRMTYRVFYKRLYRYCDVIHYPTEFICEAFEAIVGSTPHRVISNGVDRSFVPGMTVKPTDLRDKIVILFTGRLSREKNHRVLIDGVAASKYKKDIQLIFAGEGPLREALIRRAKKRGILMPIMGHLSRDELVAVLQYADLYVHPAEIEIEAISCLEAIACGKVPLIADSPKSATRGFALSDSNLFHHNDSEDLARKIDWWIEHPDEKNKCRRKYLSYAQNFDLEHCMDEMEEMLLNTIRETQRDAQSNHLLYRSGQ